jgi:hypothetical protein
MNDGKGRLSGVVFLDMFGLRQTNQLAHASLMLLHRGKVPFLDFQAVVSQPRHQTGGSSIDQNPEAHP